MFQITNQILWMVAKSSVGNYWDSYETLKISWDYNGINHLPTGAGFLPSTVGCNRIKHREKSLNRSS